MFKRTTLVLFILGLFISGLIAQPSVQLHISDKTIGAKDQVEVTYEFKNISRPALPEITFNDWDVNGPSYGQSTRIINGNASSSVSYTYTLYPKHIGTLKVPGISYDYNGKKLSCQDGTIKVLQKEHVQKKASASNSPFGSLLQGMPNMGFPSDIFGAPRTAPPPVSGVIVHPGQSYEQAAAHDFFIKITPSKSTFYVGEPILVDYEFYGAANCSWQPQRFPSFNGFSVTDIERNLYPYDVKVDGREFRARGIRKVQLIALKTGSLPLDSASVKVQTTFIDAANHADRNTAAALIKSKPQSVNVEPLPKEGQPDNFSGAIGQFEIRATVDHNKLPAGENNRLHIHITGTGNLDGVSVPDINWPDGIQSYDARDSQSVNKTRFPMERSLDFDVPFIGNKEGGIKIPPIIFSYFNPDTKKYVTDSTDTIPIQFSAPLKDNGVAIGKAQHHRTNREYLWIVALIALIIGTVFGVTEWRKSKQKSAKPSVNEKNQQTGATNSAGTGSGIGTGTRTVTGTGAGAEFGTTTGTHKGIGTKAKSQTGTTAPSLHNNGEKTEGAAADKSLQHEADHLQYLPEGLSEKIKAKNKKQTPNDQQPDAELNSPIVAKPREELRQEAIRELQQREDPKDFFVLAKAFIIEELQYQLNGSETDEKRLLQTLSEKRPDLFEPYKTLLNTCNKALYLPVASEASRQAVLDKIVSLIG